MTCVVGVAKAGKVWIGGDTAATGDCDISSTPDTPKVFKKKNFLYGFSGSYRPGQVIEHLFHEPTQTKAQSDLQYLCGPFMAELRAVAVKVGCTKDVDDVPELLSNVLLGFRGTLYEIQPDWAIIAAPADGYFAIGAGADVARGAMHAMSSKPPALRVRLALEAAECHCQTVQSPFHVLSL